MSVIIPVYNSERYFRECLTSVLHQTLQQLEIIIVDDGSTDHSLEIAKKLCDSDSRCRIVTQPNSGVGQARNTGLAVARGKYVFFIDSDDEIDDDLLRLMYQAAEDKSSDLVICGFQYLRENGRSGQQIIPAGYVPEEHEEWAYRLSSAGGRMYRQSFLQNNQLSFPSDRNILGEDVLITMASNALARNIAVIPVGGYVYRQHGDSAVHQFHGLKKYRLPLHEFASVITLADRREINNSGEFLDFGIIKFLAQCKYVWLRGADSTAQLEFREFVRNHICGHLNRYKASVRKVHSRHIDLPAYYWIAIEMFLHWSASAAK